MVKPGEKISADGVVKSGQSHVDESMPTGESQPVVRQSNSKVIGGTIKGEDTLTIEISRSGADSYLSRMIGLVKEAQ